MSLRVPLRLSSSLGARGRGCAAVPSGPSLRLASLRSRFDARSVPLALTAPNQPTCLLHTHPNWQDRRESNPQPPVLETGAHLLALGAAAAPRFPPAPRLGSLHSARASTLAPFRSPSPHPINQPACYTPTRTGRTGGNRTPNPRFWRPVLCQLSYCPNQQSTIQSPIGNPRSNRQSAIHGQIANRTIQSSIARPQSPNSIGSLQSAVCNRSPSLRLAMGR